MTRDTSSFMDIDTLMTRLGLPGRSVHDIFPGKKLAVMQPYLFPYMGYFQLFHAADKVILYDNVRYIRSGWINRNRILEINKGPRFITVPLMARSGSGRIRDAKATISQDWKTVIMKMISHNYKNAPYFSEVFSLVDSALDAKERAISELAKSSIRAVLSYLDWEKPFESDSSRFDPLEDELLQVSADGAFPSDSSNRKSRQFARVRALCIAEGADAYINPIGGTALYCKEEFLSAGIHLNFLQPELPPYPQSSADFVPNLSIIDVLMNLGKEGTRTMLSSYRLI